MKKSEFLQVWPESLTKFKKDLLTKRLNSIIPWASKNKKIIQFLNNHYSQLRQSIFSLTLSSMKQDVKLSLFTGNQNFQSFYHTEQQFKCQIQYFSIINIICPMHNWIHMQFESDDETLDSSFENDVSLWDERDINSAANKINTVLRERLSVAFNYVLRGFLQQHPEKTDEMVGSAKRWLTFNQPRKSLELIQRAYVASRAQPSTLRSQICMLYSEIALKNNKAAKGLQILNEIEQKDTNLKYYQLRAECFKKMNKKQEMVNELMEVQKYVCSHYPPKSLQEGLFNLKKGNYLRHFREFDAGIAVINKAIQILVRIKLSDKGILAEAYLSLAEMYYSLQKPYEENINLVCAVNLLERNHFQEQLRIAAQKRLIDSQVKLEKFELALKGVQDVCRWNYKKFGNKHAQTQFWEEKRQKIICMLKSQDIQQL